MSYASRSPLLPSLICSPRVPSNRRGGTTPTRPEHSRDPRPAYTASRRGSPLTARRGFSINEVPETSTPPIPRSIRSLYYSATSESLETRLISAVPLDPTAKTLTCDGKLVPGAYVWDIDLAMSKPPITRVSHVSSPVSAPIPLTASSLIAKTSSSLQSNPLVVLQSQSFLDSRDRTSACRKTASLPVFAAKKYKKVADRTYPVRGTLPEEFRIVRRAHPDLLADIPVIPPVPPPFAPGKRYTQQRHDAYNANKYGFLT